MKKRHILFNTTILLALPTGTAAAAPQKGFSLDFGIARHTIKPDCYLCVTSTRGNSYGMDVQIPVSDKLSINPFLMMSSEFTNVNIPDSKVSANHMILGVQLRYWVNNIFFGGHVGRYVESIEISSGPKLSYVSGGGWGLGLVAGWESPNSGWYMMGQVDSAVLKYLSPPDNKLSGFRLSVGYRWK